MTRKVNFRTYSTNIKIHHSSKKLASAYDRNTKSKIIKNIALPVVYSLLIFRDNVHNILLNAQILSNTTRKTVRYDLQTVVFMQITFVMSKFNTRLTISNFFTSLQSKAKKVSL